MKQTLGLALIGGVTLLLTGCATLPNSGPTARQVVRGASKEKSGLEIRLVSISATTPELSEPEGGLRGARYDLPDAPPLWSEGVTIAPGDTLQVTIFEVGVTLFGGQLAVGGAAGAGGADVTAKPTPLPPLEVDTQGMISLPYLGRIKIAGLTIIQAQQAIQQGLIGLSQHPQVVITVTDSLRNSVQVFGAVKTPGRFRLSQAEDRLLDIVARAGGSLDPSADVMVRITRAQQSSQLRLSQIEPGGAADIRLLPGDTIELLKDPQSISIFGAAKVAQIPFDVEHLSLAEAIARAGGPTDAQADASAVFVFRYDRGNVAGAVTPVIFRLNLMRPESYLLAQKFSMKDKDVVYFANATANPPIRFLNIINQLFAPIVTARVIAGN